MAQRVQVILEDDIDGGPADETVTFGLDGATYEIDLNERNAAALRDAMAAYVGAGRRSGGRRSTRRKSSDSGSSSSSGTSEIREWARANGYEVSERGRISAEVKAAYEKATS
ncbi:histone-like nucleoid-structuring protein Lsr2 [Janibacter melonis]|uniref:histone-like nucleoid-structuring protein Lsr2 n=1 Tax=Janibacter melonis TaxID=262209 RepID=UPI001919D705|nr:Lsr2 family protein [Janibacter melonis]